MFSAWRNRCAENNSILGDGTESEKASRFTASNCASIDADVQGNVYNQAACFPNSSDENG